MAVATPADVAARLGRPLTANELTQVTAYLEDAEAEIVRLGGGAKVADPNWKPLVVKVECAVVKRAARLPDALQNLIPGDENTAYANIPVVSGSVYLRREERRSLGLRLTGAAQVTPTPENILPNVDRFDWGYGWDEWGCHWDEW